MFVRFIANDDLDVQQCINDFRKDRGLASMSGVIVVCCPQAVVKNSGVWFLHPDGNYPYKPVVFASIQDYGNCKYYGGSPANRDCAIESAFAFSGSLALLNNLGRAGD